jgi:hypothetical protein
MSTLIYDPGNYMDIDAIFLGTECDNNLLRTIPKTESHKVRLDCQSFYKTASNEIQKNQLNAEFQSQSPKIHLLLDRVTSLFKLILKSIIKKNLFGYD